MAASPINAPVNRIRRDEHLAKSHFESALGVIDTSLSFNQGDLLCFDSATHLIQVPSAETDGDSFLGISRVSIVNGKILSPYQGTAVDGAQAITDIAGPIYSCVASLLLNQGETISPGDLVYLNPAFAAYSIQTSGTKAIGHYVGVGSVTAGSGGSFVEIRLGSRFPDDVLTY